MAGKKGLSERSPRQVQRGVYAQKRTKSPARSYYWIKFSYCSDSTKAKWVSTANIMVEQTPSNNGEPVLPGRDVEDVWFILPIEYVNGGVE